MQYLVESWCMTWESNSIVCIDNNLVYICTSFNIQIENLQLMGKAPSLDTTIEIKYPYLPSQ